VDGPVSAAEVWLPSTLGTGASKSSSDWETLVVFGEGRGAGSYLWSSSSSCDSGFNATYSATYQYYCGYYALDLTNTLSPAYKWRINPSATDAPYLNLPWSKMAIGRVKISGNERWVGFVGGGGYEYTCSGTPTEPTNAGKGFFVVDLTNGNVLWSFKNGATNTSTTSTSMTYSIAAPPSIVDTDNDGFIDTAYVGDLGGNIWRFSFCPNSMTTCNTSNWSGGKFYNQTLTARPIYTGAALATDASNNLWVNWGSGDKQCPALSTVSEKFYALKDPPAGTCTTTAGCNIGASGFTCTTGRCTKTYSGSDLFDATSATFSSSSTQQGWYVSMGSGGEKILAEPSLFGGKVYFTSFTPGTDICTQGGTGKLYGLNYTTAAGALGTTASPVKSINLGTGIPSAAIISMKPDGTGADMYVTNSGGAGTNAQTTQVPNANLGFPSSRTNILYWKDRRVQ
jgi:Tfp pilus tip-associated adhesin PilY1